MGITEVHSSILKISAKPGGYVMTLYGSCFPSLYTRICFSHKELSAVSSLFWNNFIFFLCFYVSEKNKARDLSCGMSKHHFLFMWWNLFLGCCKHHSVVTFEPILRGTDG